MRLTRLQLQNFKACRSVDIELAPLTVLIGANNAGKSSILHSIAMQTQSMLSPQTWNRLQPAGSVVDLGITLDGLVHRVGGGVRPAPAEIHLSWNEGPSGSPVVTGSTEISVSGEASTRVRVDLILNGIEASVQASDMSITVTDESGRNAPEQVPANRFNLWGFSPASQSQAPEHRAALEQTTVYLQRFVPEALQRFRYVGANRHIEKSVFPLGREPASDPRTAQELVDTLAYDDQLLEAVSRRCQTIFGYGVDRDLIPPQQITVVAKSPSGPRNVVNLGTGFIQTVWLLTQLELALAQPPTEQWQITPLVGIEEPELHIHPGLQLDIARLLGSFVQAGLDIVCTTQSEHLLLALLSLVLERQLTADQIVVYYLREGQAEKLAVDEQGRIDGGLRGFFEANEEQLRRQIDLLKQRG